jgi:hypothetical protein
LKENVLSSTKIRPLPVRPKRQHDEWTETYLARAVRAFGISRPWRHDLEVLRQSLPDLRPSEADGRPVYGRQEALPGWATLGRAAQIRYCCACLEQAHYIRARWRIAALDVCTVHGLNLQTGLAEPAVTCAYKDPRKSMVADVGREEAWTGANCPTSDALRHARAIWAPFEQAVLEDRDADEVAMPLAWALTAERLLDAVVTAVRGPDYPPRGTPRHEHRAAWLLKHGMTITPDQAGVLGFLLGLHEGAHRRAAISCLSRLIGCELGRPTVLSRLPLQHLKDRLLAAEPAPAPAGFGALPRHLHPPGHKSLEATEAALGCTPGLLYYLVREGHFKGVQKIRFGRKLYIFVPDEEVRRYQRLFASWLTYEQLTQSLGIDRQGYWALYDCQWIEPIEIGSWRRYRRQDVGALLNRLDEAARPAPAHHPHLLPLMGSWLHARRRVRALMRTVLEELASGRLPLYKRPDEAGLQAYYVDHEAVSRLHHLSEAHYWTEARRRSHPTQVPLW